MWGPEPAVTTPRVVLPSAHGSQGRAWPAAGTWEAVEALRASGREVGRRGAWGRGLGHTVTGSWALTWQPAEGTGRQTRARVGRGRVGRPQRHPKGHWFPGAGSRGLGTSSTRPRRDAWRPSALGPTAGPPPAGPPGPGGENCDKQKHLACGECRAWERRSGGGGSQGTQRGGRGHSHSRARGAGIRSTGETRSK